MFEKLPLYSTKATHKWLLRIRDAVKQIFSLDHRSCTLQKYVVCKSQVEIGNTFMEISLNFADFTDFF